jgi:ketopantoate reductase
VNRYIIVGAGGVGVTLAAELYRAGRDNDAIDYARYVLPLVRQELARRPGTRVPAGAGG